MYICSCHAVTDGRIRKAAETGEAKTWKELTQLTGCGTQCGICAKDAKAIFDKAKADAFPVACCQSGARAGGCCKSERSGEMHSVQADHAQITTAISLL